MQLLEDDGTKSYSVWLRWGRGEFLELYKRLLAVFRLLELFSM